ncbi:uncharacterized protein LOC111048366 [Nilaparvata lugens]|uniref:uncharacterized protein LOC111048366 n=1 Tax=Nilaparvata lugens TaxID=108931 RepID=UPI00193D9B97|nr:uncharacterized protein LOC111048366 [Nilaparvata lugens]
MAIPFNLPSEEDTEEYYRRLDQLLADLYDVLRHILFRPRTQQPAHNHQQQPPVIDADGDNESEDQEPPDHGGEDPSPDALEQRLHPLPDLVANVGSSSAAPSSRPLGRGHPRRRRRDSTSDSVTINNSRTTSNSRTTDDEEVVDPPRPLRKLRESKKRCSSLRRKPCCPASLKFSHSLKTSAENWVMVGEELRKIAEDFRTKSTSTTSTTSRPTTDSLITKKVTQINVRMLRRRNKCNLKVIRKILKCTIPMLRVELLKRKRICFEEQCISSAVQWGCEAPDLPRTKRVELKASSLLSLLVPAPFCGSVWTTVIIIVGWKLLMRHNR